MCHPIIVYGLEDARAALAAAERLGCAVTLVSAPAAAAHGGAGWFRALVEAAALSHPGVAVTAVLDCADLPGLVLGAVRAGVHHLRFSGSSETAARLAAIAASAGATLHSGGTWAGPALDLRGVTDPAAACREWLSTYAA